MSEEFLIDVEHEKVRSQINEFLKSDKRYLDFYADKCPLESRLKFVYTALFPGFKLKKLYMRAIIAKLAYFIDYSPIKVFLYRLIGVKIGKGVYLAPDIVIDPQFPFLTTIEDYAIIGWGAKLFNHWYDGKKYRLGRVTVCRGAVVGAYSFVHAGVTVGKNANVSSCNNVYKDVPDDTKLGPQHKYPEGWK